MAKRKLLDAIEELSVNNLTELEDILFCVSERVLWLEFREPDYISSEWEDKYDMMYTAQEALEEVVDLVKELEETEDKEKVLKQMKDDIEEAIDNIKTTHTMYGGLSRLGW